MIILDTNILVASLVEEDQDHERSLDILQRLALSTEKQCITYGTLIELSQVLYRARGSLFASAEVSRIASEFEILFPSNFKQIIAIYFDMHKELSFVDCEIIVISRELSASVLSFDGKLLKALKVR